MRQYHLRLIGANGQARLEKILKQATLAAVWLELAEIAKTRGLDGEFLQVIDENGEMVIRVGVATARRQAA